MIFSGAARAAYKLSAGVAGAGWAGGMEREGRRLSGRCPTAWRAMAEANLARLRVTCERAGVGMGAFDARILAWLAEYEPETCVVIAGLVSRAYASAAAGAGPLLDEDCLAGRHVWCPGGLCQCPECRHDLRRHL